jgi:hypothetical protein
MENTFPTPSAETFRVYDISTSGREIATLNGKLLNKQNQKGVVEKQITFDVGAKN